MSEDVIPQPLPSSDPIPEVHPEAPPWRRHNPFYLVSALCLLLGCWLLGGWANDPGAGSAGVRMGGLAILMLALTLYKGMVLGLVHWNVRRDGFHADARVLSILLLLLIGDATLLGLEAGTAERPQWILFLPVWEALTSVALAWGLLRVHGIRLGTSSLALLALGMMTLHGLPMALHAWVASSSDRMLPEWSLLAGAAWIAVLAVAMQWAWSREAPVGRVWLRALLATLGLAMSVHLFACLWTWEAAFHMAYLTPLLLAVAAVVLMLGFTTERPALRVGAARGAVALTGLGLLFALDQSPHLFAFTDAAHGWLALSPLRGALLVALLLSFVALRLDRSVFYAIFGLAMLLLAMLGHAPGVICDHVHWLATESWRYTGRAVPRTKLGWGLVLVTAAFGALGVGAWWNWRRGVKGR